MQNSYATGKTTYFGGLPNAQSGTLDPSGYVERESKRRSGLAAVALARRDSMQGKAQSQPKPLQQTVPTSTPGPNNYKKALNLSGLFVDPTGKLGRLQ